MIQRWCSSFQTVVRLILMMFRVLLCFHRCDRFNPPITCRTSCRKEYDNPSIPHYTMIRVMNLENLVRRRFWKVESEEIKEGVVPRNVAILRSTHAQNTTLENCNIKTSDGNAMKNYLECANQGDECVMIRNPV